MFLFNHEETDVGYQRVEFLHIFHSLKLDHKCAITTTASFEQSK